MYRMEEQHMSRRVGTRQDENVDVYVRPTTISFAGEAMRAQMPLAEPHKPEEKISLFWRVFGGTILSITALVTIQAYQAQANNIHELRSDQNRLRELASDFLKKDEFASRTNTLWNRVQDLQNLNASVTVMGTRLTAIESQAAQAEKDRKDTQATIMQLNGLRDKVAQIDDHKKVTDQDHKEVLSILAAMQSLRDKDTLLEKKLHDAESERKDLLREIQALRERLAKLEGQQQTPPTTIGKAAWR
jgi:chromosome segregation ATPase